MLQSANITEALLERLLIELLHWSSLHSPLLDSGGTSFLISIDDWSGEKYTCRLGSRCAKSGNIFRRLTCAYGPGALSSLVHFDFFGGRSTNTGISASTLSEEATDDHDSLSRDGRYPYPCRWMCLKIRTRRATSGKDDGNDLDDEGK